ncbi:N-acetylneuraminate synthase [gamma proteobacterium IMCC1989]|nr:N-acetylneuraminate synthase [gamma proteobacterium IMCC1989]
MIIERNIIKFIVFAEDSLLNALRKISDNKSRLVFSVSESGKLEGVLTDGDIRRWLLENKDADLNIPVNKVSNKHYVSLHEEATTEEIIAQFNNRISTIPIIDKQGHLVSLAQEQAAEFKIGEFVIAKNEPSFIIAEIGNNHNGSVESAFQLVDEAIAAGADCVKFQMRSMKELYQNSGDASDSSEDLGAQYTLDLLSRFQLSTEEMIQVFDYCKNKGTLPLCTPWDKESLVILEEYHMPAYKVASADLTNHDLLQAIANTGKPLICSTGMSSESEISEAVKKLKGWNANFVLLHCNSTYPTPFKDIHLNYLDRLAQIGDCPIGYSGHERGISIPIAAVAKGAKVIEKHFTMDRELEGNDHRVSLLPIEFKEMVQRIREVEQALGGNTQRRITQGEMMNREVLAKSLIINCDLAPNETIKEEMIDIKSPGKGLPPYRKTELIGKTTKRSFSSGDFFYPSDLEEKNISRRSYQFSRPFGVPVRYHDMSEMIKDTNLDIVEFHLSYKDMEEKPSDYLTETKDTGFVIHSPELFTGDHIMDLCADDDSYRQRSIDELKRVVEITENLTPYFNNKERPMIIINAGGSSADDFIPTTERDKLHDRIANSLSQIDQTNVEIIPQTMPPFPWHFGGQRFHNLMMMPDDIERFCKKYGYRICLDISHSQLACNYFGLSFRDFLNKVSPYCAHLHVVDGEGVDGEGLQIGDGNTDFGMVADILNHHAPHASFIPEIWQGHKNKGEGFWEALEALEKWF